MIQTEEIEKKLFLVSRVAYRDGTIRYKYAYLYDSKKWAEIIVWKIPGYTLNFN